MLRAWGQVPQVFGHEFNVLVSANLEHVAWVAVCGSLIVYQLQSCPSQSVYGTSLHCSSARTASVCAGAVSTSQT
eukprot:CAMPEP_0203841980 /NCGR_PEP_ID=MMETSP0359-20131031/1718_1 /ASSEMBLY_ACC=CAM_ASM_000338 /TAXON_ID=268821 /ORGANISM="Scrippsiella Hangoei, Strain SHTV-5" /LENGTH=74 /DNA_ID=CAMNT_0050756489 /DNA_START=200 /DNA_END=420 /DNA_ORIENTATION=+